MTLKAILKSINIYDKYPEYFNTDFIIGQDSFEDVEINNAPEINSFWYFKNQKKGLIKRFILERGPRTEKACIVILTKKAGGKFTPKFDFQILDITKKAFANFSKEHVDQNLIKAKVDLSSCDKNFLLLLNFIRGIEDIDFTSGSYVVVDGAKKDIIDLIGDYEKLTVLNAIQKRFGAELSEKDATLLLNRKAKLDYFKKILNDKEFFNGEKNLLGENKKDEDVWQDFFEKNPWIFGYGLNFVFNSPLDGLKLEQTISGFDFNQSGKRVDALLKSRGLINSLCLVEIKKADTQLISTKSYRSEVWAPSEDVIGGVQQLRVYISRTIKNVATKISVTDDAGNPTGELIYSHLPKAYLIVGSMAEFCVENGINETKYLAFDSFRKNNKDLEIITFDELYDRARFIVEH